MKTLLGAWLISFSLTFPALADRYEEAYRGFVSAAYRHMEIAYNCRMVLGRSRYEDARVAAENSLRLSGMPTDIALRSVEKMVVEIKAAASKHPPHLSFAQCAARTTTTRVELRAWQARLRPHGN
jgi:hypothetical protein